MEDCIGLFLLIGFILGIIVGIFIGMNSSDANKVQEELRKTENSFNEVITERDMYKNLILEKSLEENV